MKTNREKQIEFLSEEVGINASPLPDKDIQRLIEYILEALGGEFPREAAAIAKNLGIKLNG